MRAFQKIALSLLISVVAFSLFALFAFSGFFSFIESNFYDTRVRQQITQRLDLAQKDISVYQKRYFDRFSTIVGQDSVKRIDIVNQSAQDIFNRKNLFQKLLADYPGILFVRFIDEHGNIHYSTLESDILSQNQYQTVYKTFSRAEPNAPYAKQLESTTKTNAVYIEEKQGRLLFRLPWVGYLGNIVGSAAFYVSIEDLQSFLVKRGVMEPGKTLTPVGNAGFVFGADIGGDSKLLDEIRRDWRAPQATDGTGIPVASQSGGGKLFLFSAKVGDLGYIGDLVPQSEFTLSRTLQVLLSVSIFLTVFLLTFLIFSLRQDKLLVLADRIKRFQISFLKEYLESKSTLDWARWHQELALRRNEVRREIKRGIGRVGKEREAAVDGLIDKSWDEILSVIGKRVDEEPVSGREVRGLEEAIRRLLSSGELSGALARGIPAPSAESGQAAAPPRSDGGQAATRPEGGEGSVVEEAETVEELEEIEEAEAVEETEDVGAVTGKGETAEAAAPAAANESGAAATASEVEEVEELEEIEEAEAVEETEGVGAPAEEGETAETAAPSAAANERGAAATASEVEEVEELEEIEEAEAIEETEGVGAPPEEGETVEAASPSAAPSAAADGSGAAETVGEVEEVEELEEIEEAEAVEETEAAPAAEATGEAGERTAAALTAEEIGEDVESIEEPEMIEEAEAVEEEGLFEEQGAQSDEFGYRSPGELEDVEALDLEAIFHGEELLADIDIFEDSEPEEIEEPEELTEGDDVGAAEVVGDLEADELPVTGEAAASAVGSDGGSGDERLSSGEIESVGDAEGDTEEGEELEELEEVEPLEATHPEIARIVSEGEDDELEQMEMLSPAEEGIDLAKVEIGAVSEESLQQVSYGFSLFKEFQATRTPSFRGRSDEESGAELVEIDEGGSRMEENGEAGSSPPERRSGTNGRPHKQADDGTAVHADEIEEIEELPEIGDSEPSEASAEASKEVGEGAQTGESPERPLESIDNAEAEETEPEELETLEEVAEVDELPAVDEEAGSSQRASAALDENEKPGSGSTGQGVFEKRIRDLIGYNKIEIYSLADVKSMGLVPEDAVEVSDGVFKVKEEIVARTTGSENEELKTLVDSVVSPAGIDTPPIGELLSIPAVELSFGGLLKGEGEERNDEREPSIHRRSRRSREKRVMLTENGFDYDSFRADFKSNNIGIMKSLMRISQKVDAIYAALLLPKDGGLVAEYSLGLDDHTMSTLRFDSGDAVLLNIFSQKQLIYIKIPKTGIHEFDSKIGSKDIRFMKGAIYLPVVYDGKPAYLFLGLKTAEPSIQDYMLRIIQ